MAIFQGAILNPRINTCPAGLQGLPWKQFDWKYGHNDSGDFQSVTAVGFQNDIDAAYLYFFVNGWTVEVSGMKGFLSRLDAHAGWNGGTAYTDEVLENIWEQDPEKADKPLLGADFPFTDTSGLNSINLNAVGTIAVPLGSAATRLAVQAAVNSAVPNPVWTLQNAGLNDIPSLTVDGGKVYAFDGGVGAPYAGDTNVVPLPAGDYDAAYSLYKLMAAGFTQFPIEATRIKHTNLFSNLWQAQVAYANVGRIISSASMVSIEGAGEALFFSVPQAPTPGQFIETPGDLQYGWLKDRPSVSRLALFKWRTTTVYQFGLFPLRAFGAVL